MALPNQQELEDELVSCALSVRQQEERLQLLKTQQAVIESHLSELQVSRDQVLAAPGKEEVRQRIESKTDSAASVVIRLLRAIPDSDKDHPFRKHIIGVVALLGTVPTFRLSRILAEYLGDHMLAVVCRSYDDTRVLETYKENGYLNPNHALCKAAEALGTNISGRYHVLCLEDIRRYQGVIDLQGKLVLQDPTLPCGGTPAGFLGYAVNLINIDVDHLDTRTDAGCGLRETLFYRLLRETQVYESRDEMKRAISCIKDGAFSLDGGIIRGDGAMSLGFREPDIVFPVVTANGQQILNHYKDKKRKLDETMFEIHNEVIAYEKTLTRLAECHDLHQKYFKNQMANRVKEEPVVDGLDVPSTAGLHQEPITSNTCFPLMSDKSANTSLKSPFANTAVS